VNAVRFLFNSTPCGGCLKEYFTHGKMKMHLLRSASCRAYLLSHDVRHHPVPGLGSSEDQERHLRLDNRLPPLQASGPQKPRPRDRDLNLVHWDLHDAIVEAAFDLQDERDFEPTVRKLVGTFPIAWTRCLVTFRELQATIATESEPLGEVSHAHANHCLGMLSNSEEWPFLQTLVATQSDGMTSLEVLESSFVRLQIMVSHRQMLSRGTLESTELCYMPSVADADWGTYKSSWRSYRSNLLMGHCYMSYH